MSPLVWKGHLCVFTFVFYLQFSCMSAQPTHPSLSCSDHSSCSSCVGVHLNTEYCGWCSEAETCMNGNFSGPTNGNCVNWEWYGDSWTDFGGKCCSDRNNCTDCINDHNPKHECSWCMDNEQCLSSSSLNFLSCSALLNESCCDSYTKCTECNAVNGCSWCLDSMSYNSELPDPKIRMRLSRDNMPDLFQNCGLFVDGTNVRVWLKQRENGKTTKAYYLTALHTQVAILANGYIAWTSASLPASIADKKMLDQSGLYEHIGK
eukprot:TRINITY_DN1798_c0_g1_i14.p1 TRINITY_DN1798_c0_g1~~TRINITY_DN1798_c0_g1_i14.p1  ORF type:complete len:262 (-),score=17.01 TRINITY_DN1798_c0_g1_i14:511-1296(-)